MKWALDDVPIFAAVVEQNGITAAGLALNMPKSTVSQSVARLESALGVRLFERNSRALRITREGQAFYDKALLILEQAREADAMISGLAARPAGQLTVAAPPAFVQEFLAPRLIEFRKFYPEIDLELFVSSQGVNIISERFDIAIVVGALEDSELIVKQLMVGQLIWVSSPAYIAHNPLGTRPEDILPHIQICETRYAMNRFPAHAGARRLNLDLSRNIVRVNDPLAVRTALLNGAGIAPLPERYCSEMIAQGHLVEVFTNLECDHAASSLSVVHPSRRLTSPRIRVFLDFLDEVCG
ncbi:MAG: LysR family transcriptional regulator [Rhizobiales bacterium]|nr:LysR family transcriptional regulator [Hyphomicrobiales bacterium]